MRGEAPGDVRSDVVFDDVTKSFGEVVAVDDVSLEVATGEFFTFLGPSGSGKTTCLRMIAGFEHPTSGRVLLHGEDVSRVPPYDRDVNTVFQDYALFPHMTVGENVEFGLKVRRVPKGERRPRADEALGLVHLVGYRDRRVTQLSGGQRQRVALARALVNRPRVLLLDEPLGALDLKLRQDMQVELKRIQSEVGITFIYVTHDQDEALAMSDRIAVFNLGHIEQVGTPGEIYRHPASAFVAGFVGTSNIISGDLAVQLRGAPDPFTIRPERITLLPAAADTAHLNGERRATGTVRDALYLGERTRFVIDVDGGGQLTVVDQNANSGSAATWAVPGAAAQLCWERDADQLLPSLLTEPTDKGEHMRRGRITIAAVAAAAALVPQPVGTTAEAAARPSLSTQSVPAKGAQHHRLGWLRGGRLDRSRRSTGCIRSKSRPGARRT